MIRGIVLVVIDCLRDLPKTLLSLAFIDSTLPGADLLSATQTPSPVYAELSIGRSTPLPARRAVVIAPKSACI